ncbi:MAG: translation initiation factor IF-3 [Candidatus Aerophobetes bacterium]|nr:translation initiation factor IF-3 [Candidatus Aerophobetes bacterium]
MSKKKAEIRVNEQIRAKQVRVIGVKGEQLGLFPLKEALKIVQKEGLDLVEVAPDSNPPVCRILDYGKFKYQREKQRKKARKKQATDTLKEVRLSYKIGEHDLETKLNRISKFLQEGHKVKISLRFKGREMIYRERGEKILERVIQEVEEVGKAESSPSMRGRSIEQYLVPKIK